jgi:hypothetical protein
VRLIQSVGPDKNILPDRDRNRVVRFVLAYRCVGNPVEWFALDRLVDFQDASRLPGSLSPCMRRARQNYCKKEQ